MSYCEHRVELYTCSLKDCFQLIPILMMIRDIDSKLQTSNSVGCKHAAQGRGIRSHGSRLRLTFFTSSQAHTDISLSSQKQQALHYPTQWWLACHQCF